MADDVKTQEEKAEDKPDEQKPVEEQKPDAETQQPETDPHPLEPGGKRFAEVYARMRDSQREADELRQRVATLEQGQQKPAQPKESWYTPEQLQAAVDTGRISNAQMMDQLAWQRAELKARDLMQQQSTAQRQSEALSEVERYIEKVPALADPTSTELKRVATAAREIAAEMGRQIADPVVQRRALRETYGSLEKLSAVRKVQSEAQRNADTHTESSPGAGVVSQRKDPLKDVPQMYKDHWKRLGYTQARMEEEAKFIKPRRQR